MAWRGTRKLRKVAGVGKGNPAGLTIKLKDGKQPAMSTKEIEELFARVAVIKEETANLQKENAISRKEIDQQLKELGKQIGGLGNKFGTFAEGLSYFSTNPAACANCHIMQSQYDSWQKSSHHGAASCRALPSMGATAAEPGGGPVAVREGHERRGAAAAAHDLGPRGPGHDCRKSDPH